MPETNLQEVQTVERHIYDLIYRQVVVMMMKMMMMITMLAS